MADQSKPIDRLGLLGTKIGTTQIYTDKGVVLAVTVVKAGPCVVVQRKGTKDGYGALQIGLIEEKRQSKRVNKPMAGHFRSRRGPMRVLREVRLPPSRVARIWSLARRSRPRSLLQATSWM